MKKKILYIMGAGRSGTTILGILIGNLQKSYHVGEINKFFEFKGVPHARKEGEACYNVYKEIFNDFFVEYCEKELMIPRSFEYHSGLMKSFFVSSGSELNKYYKMQCKLFESLFDVFGSEVIIDSSKYPLRALMLKRLSEYDISYVYLRRPYFSAYSSFKKKGIEQPSQNLLSFTLYYFIVNVLSFIVYLRLPKNKKVYVPYKGMINKPCIYIKKICDIIDVDPINLMNKISKNELLDVGCVFEGNRIRLKEKIRFGL